MQTVCGPHTKKSWGPRPKKRKNRGDWRVCGALLYKKLGPAEMERERGKGLFGVYDKNCPLKRPNGPPPICSIFFS